MQICISTRIASVQKKSSKQVDKNCIVVIKLIKDYYFFLGNFSNIIGILLIK